MNGVLRETPEREIKLKTGHSFRLPPFPGEPLPPRLFTSTYFDTVDLTMNDSEPCLPETTPFSERLKIILQKQLRDILLHDPGTRLSQAPEELHQMRVGIRRFRALLRATRVLLEPEWYASMQEELRWLGAMLGAVRDQDILLKTAFAIGQIIARLRTRRHKTKVIFPKEWAKLKKHGREVFAL